MTLCSLYVLLVHHPSVVYIHKQPQKIAECLAAQMWVLFLCNEQQEGILIYVRQLLHI